jgi:ABC-type branched-subunit amino acid transport system substrate-binding protein
MNYRSISLLLALITLLSQGTKAADDPYQRALNDFNQGDYKSAVNEFQTIIDEHNSSHESTSWLLMGQSHFFLGEYELADQAARELVYRFPHSRYVSHAHYLRAEAAYNQGNYPEAAWQLLDAAQNTKEEELKLKSLQKLIELYQSKLDSEQQQKLMDWVTSDNIRIKLLAAEEGIRLSTKIGVILDLSGPNGPSGERLLAGIEQAINYFKNKLEGCIEIVTRDSRGNATEAVLAARALIDEENVQAMIGDLDGVCSAAVAGVTSTSKIPLIIPSSSDVNLNLIGENVFQLTPDYHLEGELMAAYAWKFKNLKLIGILAPGSDEGVQRVEGFRSRFEALGGKIAGVQWYYRGVTNYRKQLELLLNPVASSIDLDSISTDEPLDEPVTQDTLLLDSEVTPEGSSTIYQSINDSAAVGDIDALYIPIQGDEISILAPQIAAIGFSGQLLGSSSCLDAIIPDSDWRYVQGIIFPSPYQIPTSLSQSPDFLSKYSDVTGEIRDRWTQTGYNAFVFLIQALDLESNAFSITSKLQKIHHFNNGHFLFVSPVNSRVNHAFYMMSIDNGRFKTLSTPEELIKEFP